jgi:hypothetical protein
MSLHFNENRKKEATTTVPHRATAEETVRSVTTAREHYRLESSFTGLRREQQTRKQSQKRTRSAVQQQQQQQQQPAEPASSESSTLAKNTTIASSPRSLLSWNRKERNQEILKRFENHQLNPMFSQLLKGTCSHTRRHQTSYSSIEYVACCGLGHRLARMSAAAHVAAIMGAGLHSQWGCCEEEDVFTYMFGDEPIVFEQKNTNSSSAAAAGADAMITTTTSTESLLATNFNGEPFHIQFRNEVPGMPNRNSIPPEQRCPATCGKRDTDFAFYSALMQRYKRRQLVLDFMEQQHQFSKHTVVGIHVRAGNGEGGDFAKKKRHIQDKNAFVESTVINILNLIQDAADPPLLFIATDTPHYVQSFREALRGKMDVIDLPQLRPTEGEGVLFGEHKEFKSHAKETCENGWDAVFQDMMILSHADIVIAASDSSFTQAMPLSMALGRQNRKIQASFCEVKGGDLRKMQCYESHDDWSCNGKQGTATNANQVYRDVHPEWRHLF